MDKDLFDNLIASCNEAIEHEKGNIKLKSTIVTIPDDEIEAVNKFYRLSDKNKHIAIDRYKINTPCGTPSATALLNRIKQQVIHVHNNMPANRFLGIVKPSDFLILYGQTLPGSLKKKKSINIRVITEKRRKTGYSITKKSL